MRRAVGLDGRVEVELYSGDLSRFSSGTKVTADGRSLVVNQASPSRKGLLAVRFEGVHDRDAAEMLRGATLEMPEVEVPPAPEGVYYHYQLIGASVVDVRGRQIGVVSGIMETGANDVYVVSTTEGGEILVPATRNTVKDVDTVAGKITVDLSDAHHGPPDASDED